jgi:hypothetical protein
MLHARMLEVSGCSNYTSAPYSGRGGIKDAMAEAYGQISDIQGVAGTSNHDTLVTHGADDHRT